MLFQVFQNGVERGHDIYWQDFQSDCGWPFPTLEEAWEHLLECKSKVRPRPSHEEFDREVYEEGQAVYGDFGIMVIDDPAREAEIAERRRKFEEYSKTEEYKKHWGEPTES